ncbi:leukotriene B4 receptor 1-like [Paramormyrops kingsleyae]|uniref:leukotriene B4 receptor 1-like n=1 Tax=Paramormyrops kingsleyae TaxID=1676925 RepID=UPI003B96BB1B
MMQNFSSNTTTEVPGRPSQAVVPSVILGLCFLFGIPGNIWVIVTILRHFKKDNFTLKLMLNLAFFDIMCLFTVPGCVLNMLHGWNLGSASCKIFFYILFCSLYGSVLTITLMSVQRFLQVLYSQYWAKVRGSGERVLLGSLWMAACVFASPTISAMNLTEKSGHLLCWYNFTSDLERLATSITETVFGFVIPFSIMVTSYCCLYKKLNQTAFFHSQRMTKLVTSLVLAFFIFWVPVHIFNILEVTFIILKSANSQASADLKEFYDTSDQITASLVFLNSCVDPFLYAFAARNIRGNPESNKRTQDASTSNTL